MGRMAKTAKKKVKKQRRIMRLLPITVTMLSLLFIIKVNELYIGSQHLREMYDVRDAAAEEKKEEKKDEKKPEGEATKPSEGEPKKETDAKPADAAKPAEGEAKKEGEVKPADAVAVKDAEKVEGEQAKPAEGGHGGGDAKKEGEKKEAEEPKTFGLGKTAIKDIEAMKAKDAQPRFTKTEIDLLENLSRRRDELDARERELELKSKVLEATDKRINDKLTEMKTLQGELSKVLAQYNEKQDAQIKSLVKIYESMKPDEAAAIFNELEMPILLEVIGKMSERKVALVLANMSPKKARDVTQELAEKRKKTANSGGLPASPAPAPAAKVP